MTTFTFNNATYKTNESTYFAVIPAGETEAKRMTKADFEKVREEYAKSLQDPEPAEKTGEETKKPTGTEEKKSKPKAKKSDKPVTEIKEFPALTTPDNTGLKSWLTALAGIENINVKTWDKIPGRHAIEAYGKNIALVTVNKNGKFALHINAKMVDGNLPGSNIIKNGALSMYITKCNNVTALIKLLEDLTTARYQYAKDRTDTKVEVSKIELIKEEK